ncbi:protein MKS1-like [Salvia hispanica]|uniref:protein MKS1-like n=1 Tax=Salvia hispanica TaxID=49212 RepID=UPI0020094B5A|nr:protein MKS1-like [Salvia hispanica]
MNLPEFFSDAASGSNRPSPRKEVQLQGPRPTALKVNKDSLKIRKPPIAPPPHHHHFPPPPENRQPIIIYAVPPKVIHTTVNDYKGLVQRLTGNATTTSSSPSPYAGGALSPAARLASLEKTTSPKERERDPSSSADADAGNFAVGDFVGDTNVEMGALPGILSPAPGSLPAISPGFFLPSPGTFPAISPGILSPANWDPFNMFIPSPSTLFTAPMVSPSPSSCDLFNSLFDF